MKPSGKLSENFSNFLDRFKDLYSFPKVLQQTPYKIEEIDTKNNKIIIHCHITRTEINITLEDAIGKPEIINNLPSLQACWLGYYYATALPDEHRLKKKNTPTNFSLRTATNRFRIVSFFHHSATLMYLDLKLNKTYTEKAIDLIQNKFVINNIDPSQACYIGMLAGYEIAKQTGQIPKEKFFNSGFKLVQ